jgi:hypothetical protein
MFISLLKVKGNQIAIEHDSFEGACQSLNRMIDDRPPGDVLEALVLEETEYLDDQYPDFDSCKMVASLRILR